MKFKAALSIGNFDGIHRGHLALVHRVVEWKRAHFQDNPIKSVVLSFEPHPVEVLKNIHVPRLMNQANKTKLLHELGIDEVKIIPFTKDFSQTEAPAFFKNILLRDLDPAFVVVGQNFFFGKDRQGTPQKIVEWCQQAGIEAEIFSPIEVDGSIVSSSRIRSLIESGQMAAASRLLGRDYSIEGEVIHGDKRGRQIGFPTANVIPNINTIGAPCIPAKGVYLSFSTVEGRTFPSVTNVGVKPTVSNTGQLVIETHLLDFQGDLYGKLLTVEFRDRLRDEKKFNGLDELTKQIQIDTQTARARLSSH